MSQSLEDRATNLLAAHSKYDGPERYRLFLSYLQQAWDAATAGMVPEGELDALKAEAGRYRQVCLEKIEWLETNKAATKKEHEAELAKAWEAGRDAALACCDDKPFSGVREGVRDRIRALQPPGGKAK